MTVLKKILLLGGYEQQNFYVNRVGNFALQTYYTREE